MDSSAALDTAPLLPKPPKLSKRAKLLNHVKAAAKKPAEVLKTGSKAAAKAAIKWATKPALPPKQGKHPEWPGFKDEKVKLDFKLKPRAYEAKNMLENTVLSFFPMAGDRNLTPRQLKARQGIINRYQALKDKEIIGKRDIKPFVRMFDEFFFFGSLTNRARPRCATFVWEEHSTMLSACASWFRDDDRPWGFTRERWIRGYGPFAQIHLAGRTFYSKDLPLKLRYILETLIHEMVHAYIGVYMCRCANCTRNTLNTCGGTGHGPTFLMMLDAIDQTLRSWGAGLSGLAKTGCPIDPQGRPQDELQHCIYNEMVWLQEKMVEEREWNKYHGIRGTLPPAPQVPAPSRHEPPVPEAVESSEEDIYEIKEEGAPHESPIPEAADPFEDIYEMQEKDAPQEAPTESRPARTGSLRSNHDRPRRLQKPRRGIVHTPTLPFWIRENKRKDKKRAKGPSYWVKEVAGSALLIDLHLNEPRDVTERQPGQSVYMVKAKVGGTRVENVRLDARGEALLAALEAGKPNKLQKKGILWPTLY
ncbi:hypothetical protein F5Y14DRAFT_460398 [Nemania sp. NC0429]|nr:hypothetical protein F5Y14DRAFT_460398 [Nemania sp. NC0429]